MRSHVRSLLFVSALVPACAAYLRSPRLSAVDTSSAKSELTKSLLYNKAMTEQSSAFIAEIEAAGRADGGAIAEDWFLGSLPFELV